MESKGPGLFCFFVAQVNSKIRVPKMDGENNGKPY